MKAHYENVVFLEEEISDLMIFTKFHKDRTKMRIFYQWPLFERVPFLIPQTLTQKSPNFQNIKEDI